MKVQEGVNQGKSQTDREKEEKVRRWKMKRVVIRGIRVEDIEAAKGGEESRERQEGESGGQVRLYIKEGIGAGRIDRAGSKFADGGSGTEDSAGTGRVEEMVEGAGKVKKR